MTLETLLYTGLGLEAVSVTLLVLGCLDSLNGGEK